MKTLLKTRRPVAFEMPMWILRLVTRGEIRDARRTIRKHISEALANPNSQAAFEVESASYLLSMFRL